MKPLHDDDPRALRHVVEPRGHLEVPPRYDLLEFIGRGEFVGFQRVIDDDGIASEPSRAASDADGLPRAGPIVLKI